jgi:hypothetical protein
VSLKATRHRDLGSTLCLGISCALKEEIRIATDLVGLSERDPIDPILERSTAGGWEPSDPMRERSDELGKCRGRPGRASARPLNILNREGLVPPSPPGE